MNIFNIFKNISNKKTHSSFEESSIKKDEYFQLFNQEVVPILRDLGFKGSGQNYYRDKYAPYIHIVTLQSSKYGGSCCIEMGIGLGFLIDSETQLKSLRAWSLSNIFRERLVYKQNLDNWYWYGNNMSEAKESLHRLKTDLISYGENFFSKFNSFPHPFDTELTYNNISNGNFPKGFEELQFRLNMDIVEKLIKIQLEIGDQKEVGLYRDWLKKQN